jgi:hypothetical protein
MEHHMDVRLARIQDLAGIMETESEAFEREGLGTMASCHLMRSRIALCNAAEPGWFFVATHNGLVQGYAVFQPTRLSPDDCVSWDVSTDSGTLVRTYDSTGTTVFGVSIGTKHDAPDHTADMLLRSMLETCRAHKKKCFAFCSRMPDFHKASDQGIPAETYWQMKRDDGAPADWLLRYFYDALGVHPSKFLRDGYAVDTHSGGHAALVVVEDFDNALALLNKRIRAQ